MTTYEFHSLCFLVESLKLVNVYLLLNAFVLARISGSSCFSGGVRTVIVAGDRGASCGIRALHNQNIELCVVDLPLLLQVVLWPLHPPELLARVLG